MAGLVGSGASFVGTVVEASAAFVGCAGEAGCVWGVSTTGVVLVEDMLTVGTAGMGVVAAGRAGCCPCGLLGLLVGWVAEEAGRVIDRDCGVG